MRENRGEQTQEADKEKNKRNKMEGKTREKDRGQQGGNRHRKQIRKKQKETLILKATLIVKAKRKQTISLIFEGNIETNNSRP